MKLVRWLFACLSDPQRRKGAFCRQLCQRTPRQLLSLELELLEIGENGLTPAGPPCSGPGRVWKPSIEDLRFA